jgi:hypothetical protein
MSEWTALESGPPISKNSTLWRVDRCPLARAHVSRSDIAVQNAIDQVPSQSEMHSAGWNAWL